MDKETTIKGLASAIINAKTRKEAENAFMEAIKILGFSYTLFGFIFRDEDDVKNDTVSAVHEDSLYVVYGNYPEKFCDAYFDMGGLANDAATVNALNTEDTIIWNSAEYESAKRANPRVADIEALADKFGITYGATLTFWVRKECVFACAVTLKHKPNNEEGSEEDKKRVCKIFTDKLLPQLEYVSELCKLLHLKLLGSPFNLLLKENAEDCLYSNHDELTSSHIECIRYRTLGYQNKEIQDFLGVSSDTTVDNRFKEIKAAFKAKKSTSAMYRASLLKVWSMSD